MLLNRGDAAGCDVPGGDAAGGVAANGDAFGCGLGVEPSPVL